MWHPEINVLSSMAHHLGYNSSHFALCNLYITIYSIAKFHFKNVASSALWKHVNNRNETRVHLKWLGTIARAIADDNSTLTAQGKTVRGIKKPIKHSRQSN